MGPLPKKVLSFRRMPLTSRLRLGPNQGGGAPIPLRKAMDREERPDAETKGIGKVAMEGKMKKYR